MYTYQYIASLLPLLTTVLGAPSLESQPANQTTPQAPDPCQPPYDGASFYGYCYKIKPPIKDTTGDGGAYATSPEVPSLSKGIKCWQDNSGLTINLGSCDLNLDALCKGLDPSAVPAAPRGQWLWHYEQPGCSVGVRLPADAATSPPNPPLSICEEKILQPMTQCLGDNNKGLSNVATINLESLPVGGPGGPTWKAVDEKYPSWIIHAQEGW